MIIYVNGEAIEVDCEVYELFPINLNTRKVKNEKQRN